MTPVDPLPPSGSLLPHPPRGSQAGALGAPQPGIAPDGLSLGGLTDEEARFIAAGYLPGNFAELRRVQREQGTEAAMALTRSGKRGPFSTPYGDPDDMLATARRLDRNPELGRLAREVRAGDILVITYNQPMNFISLATGGPFIHTVLCVEEGPPPDFIDAMGITGNLSDPGNNKVRRSSLGDLGNPAVRLLRPTAGLAPEEAQRAVARAVAYCEARLGKPYDFVFTDRNGTGMNDAYYCSELMMKAFTDREGAGLQLPLRKTARRDEAINALATVLGSLKPDDPNGLIYDFVMLAAKPPVDESKVVDFIVERVAPGTEAIRDIADTPTRKAALRTAVARIVSGEGFKRVFEALGNHSTDEASGRFDGPWGFLRRVEAWGNIGGAIARDAHGITRELGFLRCLGLTVRLAAILVPHAETLTTLVFGPNDPRTRQARTGLDQLDAMARGAARVPVVGPMWPLPSRPPAAPNQAFVSPTDLAWAGWWHLDFNVTPTHPIDEAQWKPPARG